jgi:dehydratase
MKRPRFRLLNLPTLAAGLVVIGTLAAVGTAAAQGHAGHSPAAKSARDAVIIPGGSTTTTTSVTLDCQGTATDGTVDFTLAQSVTTTAPTSVKADATSEVGTGSLGTWSVPTSIDGYAISALENVALTVEVGGDGVVAGATESGGSNLGSGTPSVSVSGNAVTLKIPGPLTAGASVTFPTVTISADAGESGTITTTLAGTSYTSPGVTLTAVTTSYGNASSACYASPDPTLSSTEIISVLPT